jgi:hypothetical protein
MRLQTYRDESRSRHFDLMADAAIPGQLIWCPKKQSFDLLLGTGRASSFGHRCLTVRLNVPITPPNGGLESMSMSGKCRYPLRTTARASPSGSVITLCRYIF